MAEGATAAAAAAAGGGGEEHAVAKRTATDYASYEDFLDSQVTRRDLEFLQDEALARQLVELGYRGSGEAVRRDEFEARKRALEDMKNRLARPRKALASAGRDLSGYPFLQELAAREEAVRSGKLSCIIFIRDRNARGQEVSGYIDYAWRLRCEDFGAYFARSKRLLPRPSDLSFYNWETQTATSNPTPNFAVIADSETGLFFKNKRDRKVISVDPDGAAADAAARHEVRTHEYVQAVFYSHATRRRG
jgi:hypothetical protein